MRDEPPQPNDDFEDTPREVLEGMMSPSNRSFVWHSRPVVQIDIKTGTAKQIDQERFRARRIPKDADLRQKLFTAYVGLVHQSPWFRQWRKYLRATYPQFRPNEGAAFDLAREYLTSNELLDDYRNGERSIECILPEALKEKYDSLCEQELETSYANIRWRAIALHLGEDASAERRYLCRTCGLHAVARAVFGLDWTGETGRTHNTDAVPAAVHEWIWLDKDYSVLMLGMATLAGAFRIERPSGGHGEGLRGLKTSEDVIRAATWLFRNQVSGWPPFKVARRWSEALGHREFGEDEVKERLDGVRDLLGIHRPVGAQEPVLKAPEQWPGECLPLGCHPYGAKRRQK